MKADLSIPEVLALPIEHYIARRLAVPACEPAVQGRDWEALRWLSLRLCAQQAALGDRGVAGCPKCHGLGYVEEHSGIDFETDTAAERAANALQTQIAPAAITSQRRTGVPAEFSCAQCILESAWLAKLSGKNNCFGIKSYPGEFGRELVNTHEWFTPSQLKLFLAQGNGRTAVPATPTQAQASRMLYRVQDWFATFATLGDCFTRRALLFTEGHYAAFLRAYRETANLEAFVRGIAPIYATDPQYADKVLEIAHSKEVTDIVDQMWTSFKSFGLT